LGTINVLKGKEFWDFKYHFAFLLKDKGTVGAVFRYEDTFNTYYLGL